MENITRNNKTHHALQALMMMFAFLWCGNISAAIVGSGTKADPYVLENGTEYPIEAFGSFYAKFTAPSAGKFVLTGDSYNVYTDETFGTIDEKIIPQFNNDYENKEYSFECEAGRTYYVGFDFAGDAYTATFKFLTEAEPVELRSCDPADGSVLNAADASIDLKFNQDVTVGSCKISSGSNSANLTVSVRDIWASVNAQSVLLNWYNNNSIAEGDDITLTFSGVKSADGTLYGTDGIYTVTYKAGAKPIVLVSTTNTPLDKPDLTFKSYYMEDDITSTVTLRFSDNIKSIGEVTLEYGSREPVGGKDEFYTEKLTPINIGGGYILVDLKGKLRRAVDMIPEAANTYDYITLTFNEVRGNNDNLAMSTAQGSVGKFVFNYKFEEVKYDVRSNVDEGNPINADTKNIKLWISEEGGKAVFSGAEFSYKENGVDKKATVEGSSLTIAPAEDAENERIVTIPVPNVTIDADTEVTMTLLGEAPDGLTHEEFTVKVNCTGKTADDTKFAVVSALWHNGENDVDMVNGNLPVMTMETTTTVTLNKEFGYCEWTIDEDGGENIRMGYKANETPAASFDIEWFGEKFVQGKTYTFTLKAWNNEDESHGPGANNPTVGTATFTFNGAAEAYVYSDVMLTNEIDGPIALDSKEQNTYVLKFNAPANVKEAVINTGAGTSVNCAVEANSDKTEWTVTLNNGVLSSFEAFDLNIFAEDMDGHAINKASSDFVEVTNLEDNTWLTVKFTAEYNRYDLTVSPANEETVESVDKITFSYSAGIGLNWGGDANAEIVIRDREGYVTFGTFKMSDMKYDKSASVTKEMWIELDEPITDAGYYVVDVPSNFFILGQDMMTTNNKHTLVYYEVKPAAKDIVLAVNPAGGNVTEIPAIIEFTATELSSLAYNSDMTPALKDAKSNTYAVSFAYPDDWSKWNSVDVVLADGAITADGTYTLTIPAGAIFNNSDGNYSNLENIVITYIIGDTDGIDNIVANAGGKVDVYTVNGVSVLRNADAAAVKTLGKGLYIINGKKVVIK